MSSKWLFSPEEIISMDITLEQRRKLVKFIIDLGIKIRVKSNLCLYTAVAYMQRFYMVQSVKQFYPIRLCQAALFLACKSENSPVTIQQICEKTSEVLNISYNRASNAEKILQDQILDYEDALFSTLVFGFIVQHPYEHIKRVLVNAQVASRVEHSIDSLKYIAYFLAKQSILLTTFSLQYSNELIAQFCVKLATKIHDDTMISTIQLSESTDEYQQVEQLIREFSIIFINHADTYNKTFHDAKEYELYTDIRKIAEKHMKQFGDRSISRALNPTNASQCPDNVLDNHPLLQMSASIGIPSPSYSPTSPPQLINNVVETSGLKRPYEYSNDEDNIPVKRLSTILKSE